MSDLNSAKVENIEVIQPKMKWHKLFLVYGLIWIVGNTILNYNNNQANAFLNAYSGGLDVNNASWSGIDILTFVIVLIAEVFFALSLYNLEGLKKRGIQFLKMSLIVIFIASGIRIFAFVSTSGLTAWTWGLAVGQEIAFWIFMIPHLISIFYYKKRIEYFT